MSTNNNIHTHIIKYLWYYETGNDCNKKMANLAAQTHIAVTPERSILKENTFFKTLLVSR